MKIIHTNINIQNMTFCSSDVRNKAIILAASSRDLTRDMVRVKSSNVWGYNINIRENGDKTGDVYVQFKGNNGGPGDIYVYYDVPVSIYRRWQSAPSKGHYFWQYIRGKFQYSKLTGDKKTKMKGGVTSPEAIPNRNENPEPQETQEEEEAV